MKISQFKKLTRIHWLLLGLVLFGVTWLCKPEAVVTAQTVSQSFFPPAPYFEELTMGQGWGPQHPRLIANVNNDKMQDVVGFGNAGVYLSTFTEGNFFPDFVLDDFGYDQGWRVEKHVRTMGDINNDGMDDIVGFGEAGVYRALSIGKGFGPITFVVADFGYEQGWRVEKHVRLLADVNGDRQKDIVGFGEHGVWVSFATSDGNFSKPLFLVGDFGYLQGWTPQNHIRTTADVNADGMQDIVGFGDHGVWLALSTGNGFAAPQLVLADFALYAGGWQVSKHPRLLTDINNDKKDDIVGFGNAGVWISLSTGTGFTAPQLAVPDFGYDTGWRVERHPRFVADLNADGYKDIVGYGQDSVYRALGGPNGLTDFRSVLRALVASDAPYNMTDSALWAPRYVADVTGDGMADLVAFDQTQLKVGTSSDQPPQPGPLAPSNLHITGNSETSISIAWTDNSNDERRFFIYFGKAGEPMQGTIRPANTIAATIEDLEPDTNYCFAVEAENIFGLSGATREVCGKTDPREPPPPPPAIAISRIDVFNCHSEKRSLFIWTRDVTQNSPWVQRGTAPALWNGSSCPASGAPFQVTLQDGHLFWFVAVDPQQIGCNGQNNPDATPCQRSVITQPLMGKTGAPVLPHTIN